MRLLFIAADRMELAGIAARADGVRPALYPVDWARQARLNGHEILLAANGAGWSRAGSAVDATAGFRPEAIVSTGFCGALDEALHPGDIVIATAIQTLPTGAVHAQPSTVPEPNRGRQGAVLIAPIVSLSHVALLATEKRRLRSTTGACAVEMEAAGVASRADSLRLPFYCIRAVTDLATEDMSNDFNAALRSDGHFDTMRILRGAFRRPIVRLPELVRLRNRSLRAARGLGDFFADCRF